jgi:hypothetical protein
MVNRIYMLEVLFFLVGNFLLTRCQDVKRQNDDNNVFIEPPENGSPNEYADNNLYIIGSQMTIRWRTNYTKLSLAMWQNGNSNFRYLSDMSEFLSAMFLK